MAAKPLLDNIAAIVDSFKLLVDEVNPNIAVSGRMEGKNLVMEATLASKYQPPGQEDQLKKLFTLLLAAQVDGMQPASVAFENPRSAVKKKITYVIDASNPAQAHKHVMEDRDIVLSLSLQQDILELSKKSIKEGSAPEAVKAVLEHAQANTLEGGGPKEMRWGSDALLELERAYARTVMKYVGRGINFEFVPDSFNASIEHINLNSVGGVYRDDDGKGRLH